MSLNAFNGNAVLSIGAPVFGEQGAHSCQHHGAVDVWTVNDHDK